MLWGKVLKILKWITDHKDALLWLFGTGVVTAVLAAAYKLISWAIKARRERQLRPEDNPFIVLPPGSDILPVVMPDSSDSPLSDYRIPYSERLPGRSVRREMEGLLRERHALLVCGKSGLGKTREAAHLAQTLNNEGWTVLYLPPDGWLEPPARLPQGVPNRKLLFLLDDLSRRCYGARQEISPRAESLVQPLTQPFQERLRRTLEAYETFCGRSEILVLATTRNESVSEYEGEPPEWDKLEWKRYEDLWQRFAIYELPEPDLRVAADLLTERGRAAGVLVEDAETLVHRNDGTMRNLVENLRRAANPERDLPALTPETFIDTLRGTWEERYRRAVERFPEARFLYQAAALLRRYDFPLTERVILFVARALMDRGGWWSKHVRIRKVWRYLERHENIASPRDGQLEAVGPLEINERSIDVLVWVGMRYRLARALDNLAEELMWPDKSGAAVYHPAAVRILRQVTAWLPENAGAWYRLGAAFYTAKHYDEAIKAYRKAMELDPEYAHPWNGLGSVYYGLGRHEEAIEAYRKAMELDPKDAAPWNNLGNVYRNLRRYEEAIEAYQKAIELDPKDAYPLNGLGNVYDALGRYEEAIKAFRKSMELDPKYAAPWSNLGNVYRDLGRYDEAIKAYRKAMELDLKDAHPWNGLGNVYHALGQYEEAIEAYQRAMELDPKDAHPWNGLGLVYDDLGRYEEAIEAYQKAIGLDPKYTAPWNGLGNVYDDLGRYDEAIEAYQEAIELDSKLAAPWNGLGNVHRHLGRYDEAIKAYQKAMELDPKFAYPWNGLGNVYYGLGRYEEAIQAYQEAMELDPKLVAPWNNLGNVYDDLGRYDEAIEAYQEAMELDPKDAAPWNGLGNVHRHLGRYDEAIEAYRKAMELDPKLAAPWNGLGNVYDDLGRYDEAVEAYQKAIELSGEDLTAAFAHNNLADTYMELKRLDLAREELTERIRLHPRNTFAPLIQLGVLARHEGSPESDRFFREALDQWEQAWQDRYQTPSGLLEGKAIALLCLGEKREALRALREAIRRMAPGEQVEFGSYELLQAAPQPPHGIDEAIALLKEAQSKRQVS